MGEVRSGVSGALVVLEEQAKSSRWVVLDNGHGSVRREDSRFSFEDFVWEDKRGGLDVGQGGQGE